LDSFLIKKNQKLCDPKNKNVLGVL